ncbi:helix-turn-helix domain-containing protein [Novosphingobium panipatense]|uniref:Helix-turn-helix domain-containing protein n=1 Tax=Novosphingobium panipatense TaxID=428991 RepID=A0ABY1QK81_9SPHN|nr:helix-turn-helix domain-containing protein [Novosphingobium panipatense]SMP74114.1 Helix-turn-helix domain-containing protein [Novosphingobium panipatense]
MPRNIRLSPRAKEVLAYLQRTGNASSREAMLDLDINSGSFTRRITELREAGIPIRSETKFHPVSQRRYVRYYYDLHR